MCETQFSEEGFDIMSFSFWKNLKNYHTFQEKSWMFQEHFSFSPHSLHECLNIHTPIQKYIFSRDVRLIRHFFFFLTLSPSAFTLRRLQLYYFQFNHLPLSLHPKFAYINISFQYANMIHQDGLLNSMLLFFFFFK